MSGLDDGLRAFRDGVANVGRRVILRERDHRLHVDERRAQLLKLGQDMRFPIEGLHTETGPGVLEAAIEVTGAEEKVDSMVEVLQPYGVLELARTGRVTMARGAIQQPEMTRDFEDVETTEDAAVSYSV